MSKREQWLALAERCKKATGPDREIDRCIIAYVPDECVYIGCGGYTGSLDAITGLIEREFPGHWWDTDKTEKASASIWRLENGEMAMSVYCNECHTPALALCAAFCRAKAGLCNDQ